MVDDSELMTQYARERSEAAFTELVRRHLNLVHGAALRMTGGDAHLAEDVAQTVFCDLAKKASRLARHRSIAGWLYNSTRFAAANAVRAEVRRRNREEISFAMSQINSNTDTGWRELQPVVDEALGELGEDDRQAVLLRYFEASEYSVVGAALGISDNAARMRVERALEKLRGGLQKRGVAVTSAGLTAALAGASTVTASAQLALTISSTALATTAASSLFSVPVFLKIALAGGGALVITVAAIIHFKTSSTTLAENASSSSKRSAAANSSFSPEEKAQWLKPKSEPNAYQKMVERHDRSVQAQKDKEDITRELKGDFSKNWLKDEPGVKKFGGIIKATLTSGETLVSGGWLSPSGKRLLVFVTPVLIDAAGNRLLEAAHAEQLTMTSKFIELPEALLDQLNLGAFKVDGKESGLQQIISTQQAAALLQAFKKAQVDLLTAPKILSLLGRQAHVSVVEPQVIEGEERTIGPMADFLPKLSADGKSVDIVQVTQISMPANAGIFKSDSK